MPNTLSQIDPTQELIACTRPPDVLRDLSGHPIQGVAEVNW